MPLFGAFGRRRRPSAASEAEEGLMLLGFAAQMRLKNRMIVDLLTTDGAVDPAAWLEEALRVLRGFEREAAEEADRIGRAERTSRRRTGRAFDEHDYRAIDARNLRRRRRVRLLVRQGLAAWQQDPERVRALLDDSRASALEEVEAAVRRLVDDQGTATPEDEQVVRQRLDLVRTVDLPALAAGATRPSPSRTWLAAPARTWLGRLRRPPS